jgi:hypothetical protein
VASVIVGAIDQEPAHAHIAHFGEGDLLRAVGHSRMTFRATSIDQQSRKTGSQLTRRLTISGGIASPLPFTPNKPRNFLSLLLDQVICRFILQMIQENAFVEVKSKIKILMVCGSPYDNKLRILFPPLCDQSPEFLKATAEV